MWSNWHKNRFYFFVSASPQTALLKLNRANIPVYGCNKQKNGFTFYTEEQYCKKVFAIFKHSCYNVKVIKQGFFARLRHLAFLRAGMLAGAVLFLCAVILSQSFILRISVTGSGAYLSQEVLAVLADFGIAPYRVYKGIDKSAVTAKLLALPQVVFCSVQKAGSIFTVNIQTASNSSIASSRSPLVATRGGTVLNIVAICGTAEVVKGQTVAKGDTLIGAYSLLQDGTHNPCLAVGYCTLKFNGTFAYAADCESEQNLAYAKAALTLYADNIAESNYKVKKNADGVVYEFKYSAVVTYSINFD